MALMTMMVDYPPFYEEFMTVGDDTEYDTYDMISGSADFIMPWENNRPLPTSSCSHDHFRAEVPSSADSSCATEEEEGWENISASEKEESERMNSDEVSKDECVPLNQPKGQDPAKDDDKSASSSTESEADHQIPEQDSSNDVIDETSTVRSSVAHSADEETGPPPPRLQPRTIQDYRGMKNLGNTCYMNSAVQLLHCLDDSPLLTDGGESGGFITDLLSAYRASEEEKRWSEGVKGATTDEKVNRKKQPLRDALVRLFLQLGSSYSTESESKGQGAVDPSELKRVVDEATPLFTGYRQQDSHEFLSTLLDLLHDETVAAIVSPKREDDGGGANVENESKTEQFFFEAEDETRMTEYVDTQEEEQEYEIVDGAKAIAQRQESSTGNDEGNSDQSTESIASVISWISLVRGFWANRSSDIEDDLVSEPWSSPSEPRLIGGRDVVSTAPPVDVVKRVNSHTNVNDSFFGLPPAFSERRLSSLTKCSSINPVKDYFTTEVRTTLTCDSCHYVRSNIETFRHLSVEVGGASTSVEVALSKFFAPEQRELKCEKCPGQKATQTMEITRLPHVLLLHFKRFIVEVSPDWSKVTYRKDQSPVEFDEVLSLKAEESKESDVDDGRNGDDEQSHSAKSSILARYLADDVLIPLMDSEETCPTSEKPTPPSRSVSTESLIEKDNNKFSDKQSLESQPKQQRPQRSFKLRGVVNHIGSSASCGHYTADTHRLLQCESKDGVSNERRWLRFNDSSVSEISPEVAFGKSSRTTAYMVMYELE